MVMDESRLSAIVGAIHQRRGQCGGFMYHASEADARAALDRRRFAQALPSYGIRQRELVVPMLATMQEQHIASTILALSSFPNRYYRS
jgi:leucyl aminopeptidase